MSSTEKNWPMGATMCAVIGLAAAMLLGWMGLSGFQLSFWWIVIALAVGVSGVIQLVRWNLRHGGQMHAPQQRDGVRQRPPEVVLRTMTFKRLEALPGDAWKDQLAKQEVLRARVRAQREQAAERAGRQQA